MACSFVALPFLHVYNWFIVKFLCSFLQLLYSHRVSFPCCIELLLWVFPKLHRYWIAIKRREWVNHLFFCFCLHASSIQLLYYTTGYSSILYITIVPSLSVKTIKKKVLCPDCNHSYVPWSTTDNDEVCTDSCDCGSTSAVHAGFQHWQPGHSRPERTCSKNG